MQTTFRLHTQEISPAFLQSLKTLFANQEIEITVKPVVPTATESITRQDALRQLVQDARQQPLQVSADVNIRQLIDEAHNRTL